MNDPTSRRNFLRGRFSARKGVLRPPWALSEDAFLRACSRCGDCVTRCPTHIVANRDGGYPGIDFGEGECTFCGECAGACTAGALIRRDGQIPWAVCASIGEHCLALQRVECRVCGEQCEAGAISFRPQAGGVAWPLVENARCTGCGACVASCPTRAVSVV
ncbi:MAG: ferredoxin-type protein NapF [Betaproteobacteria bacterium]|nr:ferredoxin-type protein NapF [Betaproteobacteria bacterium]